MNELKLDLSRHCVETEIKRIYNRALSDYFRTGQDRERLEGIIDLTQQALQALDFNHLRATHTPLAGHSDARVVLARQGERLSITIDGRSIDV